MARNIQLDGCPDAMEIDDPIMTVRQYNALPKAQAELFLAIWVERQADKVWAEQQQARLRRQLILATMGLH
jgi:hypothetical protein